MPVSEFRFELSIAHSKGFPLLGLPQLARAWLDFSFDFASLKLDS